MSASGKWCQRHGRLVRLPCKCSPCCARRKPCRDREFHTLCRRPSECETGETARPKCSSQRRGSFSLTRPSEPPQVSAPKAFRLIGACPSILPDDPWAGEGRHYAGVAGPLLHFHTNPTRKRGGRGVGPSRVPAAGGWLRVGVGRPLEAGRIRQPRRESPPPAACTAVAQKKQKKIRRGARQGGGGAVLKSWGFGVRDSSPPV